VIKNIITGRSLVSPKSIFPTADELLNADEETLAMGVLGYIEKNKDVSPMRQIGRLSKPNFDALVGKAVQRGAPPKPRPAPRWTSYQKID
jgi:hypothetical protein